MRPANAPPAEELEDARERQDDLAGQIERCRTLLDQSRRWVRFDERPFRDALSCALELLNAPPLQEHEDEHGQTVWAFPPLKGRVAADPSWTATLDSLACATRVGSEACGLAQARADSPGGVQGRRRAHRRHGTPALGAARSATAAGAIPGAKASSTTTSPRACLAQARDSIPRVILLGRLALYGATRRTLARELVPVTARWGGTGPPSPPVARPTPAMPKRAP